MLRFCPLAFQVYPATVVPTQPPERRTGEMAEMLLQVGRPPPPPPAEARSLPPKSLPPSAGAAGARDHGREPCLPSRLAPHSSGARGLRPGCQAARPRGPVRMPGSTCGHYTSGHETGSWRSQLNREPKKSVAPTGQRKLGTAARQNGGEAGPPTPSCPSHSETVGPDPLPAPGGLARSGTTMSSQWVRRSC